ncbi:RTA1 like protein-domain-containing protein [Clohesyomyces aquaticus]|uniref:RTA1 like protein-domain-containing protein n=1 Tax=Clohesyomyces aquaticus TaxID=1231657 RepID=A0A1Y2A102_9PLEO|nr:RTA1 like protein-domain-containing protein [Clohesyomyces aquaticus]
MGEFEIDTQPRSISIANSVHHILLLLFTHSFRFWKTKTWFCIPFVVGGIFELIGYASRIYGHYNPNTRGPFLIQIMLILLAPILFTASVYMFLSRIITATDCASSSIIQPRSLTTIFVGSDIFCFLVQLVGAGVLANATTKSKSNLGNGIIFVGLGAQIIIFGLFIVVALVFHVRVRGLQAQRMVLRNWTWERYLITLYAASGIITVRNVFRVVEYAMGDGDYLLNTEWPMYVFDAVPMIIVMGVCREWYVGKMDFAAKGSQDVELMAGQTQRGGQTTSQI